MFPLFSLKAKNIVATEVQKKISKKMEIHFKSLVSGLKNTVSFLELLILDRNRRVPQPVCVSFPDSNTMSVLSDESFLLQDYSAEGWNEIAGVVLQHLRRLDLLATKTKADLQD